MVELTFEEFVGEFDPSISDELRALGGRDGVTHLVLCENRLMDSSQYGARTAVAVGPGCSYKSPEEMEGKWLHDLPSQREYAVAFTKIGGE